MKRLINITLVIAVVLLTTTCPHSQTRPRRVTPPSNELAETSRSRTVEQPVEETRETPVERPPKHHNWKRILGTAAVIGASATMGGGSCTPSRDVFRGPR